MLATIGFVALGIWQVERRTWKLDLIARVEARVHAAPTPLPPPERWAQLGERNDAYRHVQAQGTWIAGCDTFVQAITELGGGYWLMTALQTQAGVVLVNRGFVPPERREQAAPNLSSPVAITGLLRMSEPNGTWLRANDPAANRWVSRDVAAIAATCGIAQAAPFFIDADRGSEPSAYPVGGLTIVAFRNSHFVYALTWFLLAGLAAGGTTLLLRTKPDA